MGDVIHVPLFTIRHGQIGGTEFAIYNLMRGLVAAGMQVRMTYGHDRDLSPDFLQWANGTLGASIKKRGGLPGPKGVRFLEEAIFQNTRRDHGWAIFPNYFCPPSFSFGGRKSCVILHDIQYRQFPEYHSDRRRKWLDFYLPKMFDTADLVVLISKSELALVRNQFGDRAADKCVVIYNAIDFDRFDLSDSSFPVTSPLSKPYILSVCHHFPHKNLATLLEAFVKLAERDALTDLILVGSASDDNRALIHRSLPEQLRNRVHITGFVTDAELSRYYAHASLFVLPSLYEGFGMPAVEALGLGVPTLVSNAYALPEVTLGYAELINNPLDPAAWANAMEAALRSGARPDVNAIAHIRATYAPEQIGRSLLAALQSCDAVA